MSHPADHAKDSEAAESKSTAHGGGSAVKTSAHEPVGGEKETARVEAFSDGVFAIAITLLILELKVPKEIDGRSLAASLLAQWPSYVAFLTSFFCIGIMWINHHRLFTVIKRTDHGLLVANGLLLLGVTVVPFPTAVLAEHWSGEDGHTAAMLFNGSFAVIAVFFQALWRHASSGGRLLGRDASSAVVTLINKQFRLGAVPYMACTALAAYSVAGSLALNIALAVWWSLPPSWFERSSAK